MNETPPTIEQWQTLYELASLLKDLAPWEFMQEVDIFGVKDSLTGSTNYVSIMGVLGEHLSLAVYLGDMGISGFFRMQEFADTTDEPSPEMILETPQLQISFEDRSELRKEDLKIVKQLGLKFRGRQSWPLFRIYRPGMVPWFINTEEAHLLITAIQQLLDVAPRFRDNQLLLYPENEAFILIRKEVEKDGKQAWEDIYESIPQPPDIEIHYDLDPQLVGALHQTRQVTNTIEADLFLLPSPIHEKGQRPFFPYMLMMVEAESTTIMNGEMLSPNPSLNKMWQEAGIRMLECLAQHGVLPKNLYVQSDLLFQLWKPLCENFGIELKKVKHLKALSQVREELDRMMLQ